MAFLLCFAAFAFLDGFGAVVAASVAPPSRLWIAFQIRVAPDLRSVNFFTGVRPGMPFQTSSSLLAGQSATRLANSCWRLNVSASLFTACWRAP